MKKEKIYTKKYAIKLKPEEHQRLFKVCKQYEKIPSRIIRKGMHEQLDKLEKTK